MNTICCECEGDGVSLYDCSICAATGEGFNPNTRCYNCSGAGQFVGECDECNGTGIVSIEGRGSDE